MSNDNHKNKKLTRNQQRKRDQRNMKIAIGATIAIVIALLAVGIYSFVQNRKPELSAEDESSRIFTELSDKMLSYNTADPSTYPDLGMDYMQIYNLDKYAQSPLNKVKYYFVLGSIDQYTGYTQEAYNNYTKAFENLDETTPLQLEARLLENTSEVLNQLGQDEEATQAFNKVVQLYEKNGFDGNFVTLCMQRGMFLVNYTSYMDEAIEILQLGLKHQDLSLSESYVITLYLNLGNAYWANNQPSLAIESKLQAISIGEEIGSPAIVASAYTDVGLDYMDMNNLSEAIRNFTRALQYTTPDNPSEAEIANIVYIKLNLYQMYAGLGDLNSAKEVLSQLSDLLSGDARYTDYDSDIVSLKVWYADYLNRIGKSQDALELLTEANYNYIDSENFAYLDFNLVIDEVFGNIYYSMGDYNKALEYHISVYDTYNEIGMSAYNLDTITKALYLDYEALGNHQKAAEFAIMNATNLRDSQFNSDLENSAYLLSEFDAAHKGYITKSAYNTALLITIAIAVAVIIIISLVVFFIVRSVYKKRHVADLKKLYELQYMDSTLPVKNGKALFYEGRKMIESQVPMGIMAIEISNLSTYVSEFGHAGSINILTRVLDIVNNMADTNDLITLYRGSEIVAILNASSKPTLERISKDILDAIANDSSMRFTHNGVEQSVQVNIGMCLSDPKHPIPFENYINIADKELNKARNNGTHAELFDTPIADVMKFDDYIPTSTSFSEFEQYLQKEVAKAKISPRNVNDLKEKV